VGNASFPNSTAAGAIPLWQPAMDIETTPPIFGALIVRWRIWIGFLLKRVIGRHLGIISFLAIFLLIEFLYPRFVYKDDEVFFKSAGRNLSQQGTFAAPEFEGFLHLDPPIERINLAYPPLYGWLFGQWTRLTGFGWAACVGYDAVVSALLAVTVYGLAHIMCMALLGPLSIRRRTTLALVTALLTLLFRHVARPDELAMALAYANAWWLLLPRVFFPRWLGAAFISGVLAGLLVCTSLGAFLAFIPLLTALWLLRVTDVREVTAALAATILGGAFAVVLSLTPLFVVDPHVYRQPLQHFDYLVLNESFRMQPLSVTWQVSRQHVFILFATLPVLCLGIIRFWRGERIREMLSFFVAPLVGFSVVFFLHGWWAYWWFLQPWFVLIAIVVVADFWCSRRSRLLATAVVAWLAMWLAIAGLWPAKNYLARIILAPEQRLSYNIKKLRELIPIGATVLTVNGWWALGNDRLVYDPGSDIEDLSRIQYFVTDGNGTGQPGVWWPPHNPRYQAMVRENFEVISDTLPRTPLRIFGLRITNSAYGFGTIVLRRRPAQLRN
jgi:hypothetical protein